MHFVEIIQKLKKKKKTVVLKAGHKSNPAVDLPQQMSNTVL